MKKWMGIVLVFSIVLGLFAAQGVSRASGPYAIDRSEGGTVTASSDDSPDGEGKLNAFDNSYSSKWLVTVPSAWIQYQFPGGSAYAINSYTITAANDYPERDPKNWTLTGSNDGTNWTQLDTQQNQDFADRFQSKTFTIANTTAYSYYRFTLDNHSGSILQLAELKLNDGTAISPIQPVISASGENLPDEGKDKVYDGTSITKWLTASSSGWLSFDFGKAITLDGYAITSANDADERDPKNWTLYGSNDGTSWTAMNTQSDQTFQRRHQRNQYLLEGNTTAYRYYKLELSNHSGDVLQIGEVEFSYLEDMWHIINPQVTVKIIDTTTGNGALFEQALPDAAAQIKGIIRKICSILYDNPNEAHKQPQSIVITVENIGGVAGASGTSTEGHIAISSSYLRSYYNSGQPLRYELLGILYHELTHLYQYDDNAYGSIGYMIEGMADAIRFDVGHHDRYAVTPGGSWTGSYGVTGNFLRWIDDYKHHGFLREINASLNPFDTVTWTENAFQQITGTDVNTLWSEYQNSLDHQAPSVPTNLAASAVTSSSVGLTWGISSDNVSVAGYNIYQDGVKVGTSTGTSYTATGLAEGTTYSFAVEAFDAAGNVSGLSSALAVKAANATATIYYKRGYATPYFHYQVDGGSWTTSPGVAMTDSEYAGYSKITVNLGTATGLTGVFNNGSGTWDNNGGNNYRFPAGASTFVNGAITAGVPQADSLTIVVSVPSNTPASADLYLASSLNSWNAADSASKLTKNADGTYSIKLNVAAGTSIQYKITKGTWAGVEAASSGADIANRTVTTTGGAQTVSITVQRWKDQ